MDLKLMMEPSDLSKAGYESVCATRACEDVIKLSLVDVLTHYISPNELYVKIQSCLMLITGKDKLTPDQWKRCFPDPPLLPDYKTFDFLLLYKLIRHLCPLLRPTQGHKYTLIDDYIEILRLLYFYLIDISNRMHDGKFEESFKSVRDEVRRFQNLTKYKSNYNYEEELNKTILKKLGYKYPKKEEQLGNMQFTLNSSEFSDKKGKSIFDNYSHSLFHAKKQTRRKMLKFFLKRVKKENSQNTQQRYFGFFFCTKPQNLDKK